MFGRFSTTLGIATSKSSEMLITTFGVVVTMIALMSLEFIMQEAMPWFVIASIGSSAIILFATPHAPNAQPWAVFMGHLIGGVSGLVSLQISDYHLISVPVALGLTSLFMVLLRARHAPAGATALFLALGGVEIEVMYWSILWLTLLPSVLVLLGVAFFYNLPFKWRRYPYFLHKPKEEPNNCDLNHEDLAYAAETMHSYFNMSEQEFLEIYRAAKEHHKDRISKGC